MVRIKTSARLLSGLAIAAVLARFQMPAQAAVDTSILPADRTTLWDPGLNTVGGIPNRTSIFQTLTPSGGDDTAAIQNAINACPPNQVVKLGPGTFQISGSGLVINQSSVTLRGSGPRSTRLVKAPGSSYPVLIFGSRWTKYTQPQALTANALKGATSVTVAGNPGYRIGEIVVINALTDPSYTQWDATSPPGSASRGWFGEYDRPVGQVMEIIGINGNTLQFSTPLHSDFRTSFSAHVVRFSADMDGTPLTVPRFSGVEDLYVSYGEGGDGGGNIHLFASAYCWVKNVESDHSGGSSVNFDGTFRCVLRDSYLHSTTNPTPGGGGYGLSLNSYASDNLVENNVSWYFNKVMVMRATGGGNVIAYNYMEDGFVGYSPVWVEVGLNASHMTTPHMELFEGNQSFNFGADARWGNSLYVTAFRNHMTTLRRAVPPLDTYSAQGSCTLFYEDLQNRRAIELSAGHYYYTFVGNVLGTSGMSVIPGRTSCIGQPSGGFEYEQFAPFNDNRIPLWKVGTPDGTPNMIEDPQVAATLLRGGNYDFVTQTTHWENLASQTLPASLYLSARPVFMGTTAWPPIGPDVPGYYNALPARACFDAGQMPDCLSTGIPPGSRCDVDGSGTTNVSDVQLCSNQAIGISPCVADINQDGLCNVVDVQRVVNNALGGACITP